MRSASDDNFGLKEIGERDQKITKVSQGGGGQRGTDGQRDGQRSARRRKKSAIKDDDNGRQWRASRRPRRNARKQRYLQRNDATS